MLVFSSVMSMAGFSTDVFANASARARCAKPRAVELHDVVSCLQALQMGAARRFDSS
jgi:hypothetical protein